MTCPSTIQGVQSSVPITVRRPRTRIVVLNWNGRDMTAECLRSLLAMDAKDLEILVIDNGSRDGSVEYLRSTFPQGQVVANGRNLGFAAACNIGMERGLEEGAEFVLLVNNDTLVAPGMLKELLLAAESEPRAAIVSPKIFYFDHPARLWWGGGRYSLWRGLPSHIGRRSDDRGQHDKPRSVDWATGCVMLLRCAALRDFGFFDERIFGNGEDLDLSLRARKRGWRILYAPRAEVWHKEGFDYRRNVGEHVRIFTASRNLPWIMRKHGNRLQRLAFWPQFIFAHLPFVMLQSVRRGDFRSAGAALAGTRAYFEMCRNPEAVALPEELVRTTVPREKHAPPNPQAGD